MLYDFRYIISYIYNIGNAIKLNRMSIAYTVFKVFKFMTPSKTKTVRSY